MNHIDISTFNNTNQVLKRTEWLLVVKSQEQIERRRRMLGGRSGDKFGRISARPTAIGLLVFGKLVNEQFETLWSKEFREPRHIKRLNNGDYLLTEINRLLHLTPTGEIIRIYEHPFFGFLHSINLSPDGKRALVSSSGYDTIIELDLLTGKETFRWNGWEHGFNPDEDGYWLSADKETYNRYLSEGKRALIIDPADYGEQGLMTARRTVHPSVAAYDLFDDKPSIILLTGHNGNIYRVNRDNGNTTLLFNGLNQMPHGLFPYGDGWAVTNTTRGQWWIMDKTFTPKVCYSVESLDNKIHGTEEVEWVQQVIPIGERYALFLDANRGLIAVDFLDKEYSIYQPNENWCIQDAFLISQY